MPNRSAVRKPRKFDVVLENEGLRRFYLDDVQQALPADGNEDAVHLLT